MTLSGPGALVPMAPPEEGEFSSVVSYSSGVYHLIEYSFVVAGFALLAGAIYGLMARTEVGTRYRPAVHASVLLQTVAAIAYLALFVTWHQGFDYQGGIYVPDPTSRFGGGLRYADWSITVPLLSVELLAVTSLVGKALARSRAIAIGSAFLMIITGFLGAVVFYDGTSSTWLNIWAAISTVFFLVLYGVLGKAVMDSRRDTSKSTFTSLVRAAIVLFAIFGAYPLLYLVQVLVTPNSNLVVWAVVVQMGFSFSDIIAKVGFGAMVHKVAKLRTAEEVNAGTEVHDEPVFVDHEMQAAARPAIAEALAGNGATASNGVVTGVRTGR